MKVEKKIFKRYPIFTYENTEENLTKEKHERLARGKGMKYEEYRRREVEAASRKYQKRTIKNRASKTRRAG